MNCEKMGQFIFMSKKTKINLIDRMHPKNSGAGLSLDNHYIFLLVPRMPKNDRY